VPERRKSCRTRCGVSPVAGVTLPHRHAPRGGASGPISSINLPVGHLLPTHRDESVLKSLQGSLGTLNDIAVHRQLATSVHVDRPTAKKTTENAIAIGFVTGMITGSKSRAGNCRRTRRARPEYLSGFLRRDCFRIRQRRLHLFESALAR
jgi:hypothetical protein